MRSPFDLSEAWAWGVALPAGRTTTAPEGSACLDLTENDLVDEDEIEAAPLTRRSSELEEAGFGRST
jgi:hypothetical protein